MRTRPFFSDDELRAMYPQAGLTPERTALHAGGQESLPWGSCPRAGSRFTIQR